MEKEKKLELLNEATRVYEKAIVERQNKIYKQQNLIAACEAHIIVLKAEIERLTEKE